MPSFVLLCSCVYNSVLYKYYFLSVFRVWGIPKHYDYLVPREVISLSLIRRGLEIGTWKLGLGNWDLEIGPWKLALGNWTLEIGPWKLGLGKCSLGMWSTCKSIPLLFETLGIAPLGNPLPLEKRYLATLVPCRKPLGKRILGIFTLGNKCLLKGYVI